MNIDNIKNKQNIWVHYGVDSPGQDHIIDLYSAKNIKKEIKKKAEKSFDSFKLI